MAPGPICPGNGRGAGQEVGPILRCLLGYAGFSTLSCTIQIYPFPPNTLFPDLFLLCTRSPQSKAIITPEWLQPNSCNMDFSPHPHPSLLQVSPICPSPSSFSGLMRPLSSHHYGDIPLFLIPLLPFLSLLYSSARVTGTNSSQWHSLPHIVQ